MDLFCRVSAMYAPALSLDRLLDALTSAIFNIISPAIAKAQASYTKSSMDGRYGASMAPYYLHNKGGSNFGLIKIDTASTDFITHAFNYQHNTKWLPVSR